MYNNEDLNIHKFDMKGREIMDIKHLLENENYIIICDTNVYLDIYRYSPEFSEFATQCMRTVQSYIILPSTVRLEYLKHYRSEFGSMKKKVKTAGAETKNQIERSRKKVIDTCDTLRSLHYPDISELRDSLENKFSELEILINNFFEDRNILELISSSWGDVDLVYEIVEEITKANQIMPPITQENIYRICEEGEKRYKAKTPIPPGFKDAKDKDGVRKYSDLILWKEVIEYSKDNQKNVIFVTNDVKSDWWLYDNDGIQFHPALIKEFISETSLKIIAYSSSSFFIELSKAYSIEQTDAIEIALRITDKDYFSRVNEKVFDKIIDDISLSGEEYIETFSAHIGTEGIGELEIIHHEFLSAERVNRDENNITYVFTYKVTVEATSFDYWGRDDDIKDIILSPGAFHQFEGTIDVEVVREADLFLDFESDNSLESVEIIEGNLIETNYQPYFEEDELLEGTYTACPDCGCQINFENDGGNGFCSGCASKY